MHPSRPARLRVGAVAAAVALGGVGLATVTSPAQAEPTPPAESSCPTVFDGTLEPGQKVTGLTTVQGTKPVQFTGTYIDTVDHGFEDGTDLVLFSLEGPRITKADGSPDLGAWPGISGSPVYAENGQLVGSVAYGVDNHGPVIVGITPAAEQLAVGSSAAQPKRVSVRTAKKALARSGSHATTARRLDTPLRISGLSGRRLALAKSLAARAHIDPDRIASGTAAGTGSSFVGSEADLVAGAPVGLTYSTGDITLGGNGTVTARCGNDVYAFGHPADWLGDQTAALLHPFSVSTITSDDSELGGGAYGNFGTAVGRYTQDREAGVLGQVGATAPTTAITSRTTLGETVRDGGSVVSQPEVLPYVVADQAVYDYLEARDAYLGGFARLTWKIGYTRAGKAETFQRSNVYSDRDPEELIDELTTDVAGDVYTIAENDIEDVTITSVAIDDTVDEDQHSLDIASVQVKGRGGWKTISSRKALIVSRSASLRVRAKLVPSSRFSVEKAKTVELPKLAATKAGGPAGSLDVSALSDDDDWFFDDDEFFGSFDDESEFGEDLADATTFPQLIEALASQQSNDSITATLSYRTSRGAVRRPTVTRHKGVVVNGSISVPVRFVP